MIQFVVGATAGYVIGTRAGRKRYSQIKNAYERAVNSPATKAAMNATRKAIANKLDPQPRMREVKNIRRQNDSADSRSVLLEPDED